MSRAGNPRAITKTLVKGGERNFRKLLKDDDVLAFFALLNAFFLSSIEDTESARQALDTMDLPVKIHPLASESSYTGITPRETPGFYDIDIYIGFITPKPTVLPGRLPEFFGPHLIELPNPQKVEGLSEEEHLKLVLTHEMAHVLQDFAAYSDWTPQSTFDPVLSLADTLFEKLGKVYKDDQRTLARTSVLYQLWAEKNPKTGEVFIRLYDTDKLARFFSLRGMRQKEDFADLVAFSFVSEEILFLWLKALEQNFYVEHTDLTKEEMQFLFSSICDLKQEILTRGKPYKILVESGKEKK